MATWQRKLRLVVAIGAVGFAVVLAFGFKRRAPGALAELPRTDPKALVESSSGRTFRVNRNHEEVRIDYQRLLTYADGSSKMLGVKVVTERAGGRTFTISGKVGDVAKNESDFSLDGDVEIAVSDGMTLRTDHAAYTEADGMVRAPGAVQFERGRMTGSGVGMTYDKTRDVMTLLDRVVVNRAADAGGAALAITSGTAEFNRADRTIHFDKSLHATRGGELIEADAGLVHLSGDDAAGAAAPGAPTPSPNMGGAIPGASGNDRLQAVELRGHSRITRPDAAVGGFRSMDGRDIDLTYASDGETLQRTVVTGAAVIQLAGQTAQAAGRQIAASRVDLTLAPDGSTPTALTARENVQLTLAAEPGIAARTVMAQSLDGRGEEGQGLTSAHFEGAVRYREQGSGIDRRATSQILDAALGPGISSIDDAKFARTVRFEDGTMTATAAAARYVLAKGTLELTGVEPVTGVPRVVTDQIAIDATRIDITLAGPIVQAAGTVKSVLQPAKPAKSGTTATAGTKLPAMLKQDQPVTVTAAALDYDGGKSLATYTGDARLYQGDTSIRGETLTIDDKSGDLTATGVDKPVITVTTREQDSKDKGKGKEKVNSTATAKHFVYDDADRTLTYTGDAHVLGTDGDMKATRIDMFLTQGGDEIEHVEAHESVALREPSGRNTTGDRLTYHADTGQYEVTGTPVVVLEPCGRETRGRTLTLFKATDRIVVDGNEQTRTQTKGGSNCP